MRVRWRPKTMCPVYLGLARMPGTFCAVHPAPAGRRVGGGVGVEPGGDGGQPSLSTVRQVKICATTGRGPGPGRAGIWCGPGRP